MAHLAYFGDMDAATFIRMVNVVAEKNGLPLEKIYVAGIAGGGYAHCYAGPMDDEMLEDEDSAVDYLKHSLRPDDIDGNDE